MTFNFSLVFITGFERSITPFFDDPGYVDKNTGTNNHGIALIEA